MIPRHHRPKGVSLICVGLILGLVAAGCTGAKVKDSASASSPASPREEEMPLYYDFGDVLVPRELKVDRQNSFIYRTPGFSAGVLVLRGRVEPTSLISFFENNMAKDNWRAISAFKSPRTMMMFQKQNRWCVVNITAKNYTTHVEIWVSPTLTEE